MLERLIKPKDTNLYNYETNVGNILDYNMFEVFIERSWVFISNWPDYLVRLGIIFYTFIIKFF